MVLVEVLPCHCREEGIDRGEKSREANPFPGGLEVSTISTTSFFRQMVDR